MGTPPVPKWQCANRVHTRSRCSLVIHIGHEARATNNLQTFIACHAPTTAASSLPCIAARPDLHLFQPAQEDLLLCMWHVIPAGKSAGVPAPAAHPARLTLPLSNLDKPGACGSIPSREPCCLHSHEPVTAGAQGAQPTVSEKQNTCILDELRSLTVLHFANNRQP